MATECCQLDGDKAIQLQIISTDDEDVSGKRSKMIITGNLNDELAFETTSIIRQYLNKSQRFWKNKRY